MSVFHLKYRPTLISELDSAQAAESLRKILAAKDIPQSFLFTGPKGSGKTSAARILARALNCKSKINGEPCDKCDNCKSILDGKEMDIVEIDAASNRGIEDIRSLKDKAYLMPSKLDKKVFIIDEVHMLTKDAFNALLKLIEEPPKHTVFVLCTTDPEKIPETVLSRLMRVDFRKGNKEELLNSLQKVIKGENLKVDNKVVDFIIEKSDGSFRNLHRNFNEIYLHLGEKITFELVESFYKVLNGDYNEVDFENDLSDVGNLKNILEKLEQMAKKGVDFRSFNQRLLIYFQNKLLLNFGVGEGEKAKLDSVELERFIELLIKAIKQEKDIEIGQLPLELAVIDFLDKKQIGVKKNELSSKVKTEIKKEKDEVKNKIEIEVKEERIIEKVLQNRIDRDVNLDLAKIESDWGNLLMAVKPFNHSVEAFLRATRPVLVKNGVLVLEVFYPFHKDRLEEVKNRRIVEDGIEKVFGVNLEFKCILAKDRKKPLVIDNQTPVENISEDLIEANKGSKKDLYDVAKDIFG
ncbi:MAG: DNA polymerase III subunit gamma/tau [Candidatus Shapirobacteria bacterium]|nr:DNA polymerase III subunit gamma/tau [Candidatus Shapirobacteria bacterium]